MYIHIYIYIITCLNIACELLAEHLACALFVHAIIYLDMYMYIYVYIHLYMYIYTYTKHVSYVYTWIQMYTCI